MTLLEILILYIAFRLKQLTCDFFLQSAWMALSKGNPTAKDGPKALALHAAIHAAFTLALMLYFAPGLWWLALVDFIVHGIIDKTKGAINYKMKLTHKDTGYWWTFALDQEAHNFTHLAYIVLVVLHNGAALQ